MVFLAFFWSAFMLLFIFIPLVLFWIFALADMFRRTDLTVVGRVVWLIVIIMLPILGPIIYLLVRPPVEMVKYRE
ncbi:MAG: hypothetical protein E3J64_01690 [Anaerolineales bacterium]|nr:MAG: hypothetical protein E3J64_01690 [Anaerolineales bacterium]